MVKTLIAAFSAIVFSFALTVAVVNAQSPSPEAEESPSTVPSAAPTTGQAAE